MAMERTTNWKSRSRGIALWIVTIVIALGIGGAGASKFLQADHWRSLFVGWGYPSWLSMVIGVAEVLGAIGLIIPRLAFYAALLLWIVMMGALLTLLTHQGGPMGWGATPTVYLILLSSVGAARRKQRLPLVSRTHAS
jgi:putative oxidoreductase